VHTKPRHGGASPLDIGGEAESASLECMLIQSCESGSLYRQISDPIGASPTCARAVDRPHGPVSVDRRAFAGLSDHDMYLGAREPAHRGFAALGETLESAMLENAASMADGTGGGIHEQEAATVAKIGR
jgi:hypothetical protein